MPRSYAILLVLCAVMWAYVIARNLGVPGTVADVAIAPVVLATLAAAIRDIVANPRLGLEATTIWLVLALFLTPLAVPAYIRLHGLPWRRML